MGSQRSSPLRHLAAAPWIIAASDAAFRAAGLIDFLDAASVRRPAKGRSLQRRAWISVGCVALRGFADVFWSSVAMLRRYLGKIPVAQLKRYPTTLERVFGRAV
jgi:hypothetical protein